MTGASSPNASDKRQSAKGGGETDDGLLSNVAMLYYKEGLTQSEISQRIGVSRASVVNYLRQARDRAIVDIRIEGAAFAGSGLSRVLCQKFGLADVYVAHAGSPEAQTQAVAQVAAMAMFDLLCPGDWLGVSWGETVLMAAQAFPQRPVSDLTVCQMLGSMSSPTLSAAEDCAIRLAGSLGARCYTLHAPAIVSSAGLAHALRREPIIAAQLSRMDRLTKAFFSVGSVERDTLMVTSGICSNQDLQDHLECGAAAVVCGRFIDRSGRQMPGDLADRMIGVDLAALLRVPTRMCLANGADKYDAVRTILTAGFVTHLVIDAPTALRLAEDGTG